MMLLAVTLAAGLTGGLLSALRTAPQAAIIMDGKRNARRHAPSPWCAGLHFRPSITVFFDTPPNSLEKPHAGFHYSVIGRFATVFQAAGYVGGHLLNDDDAASNSKVEVSARCVELITSFAQKAVNNDVSRQAIKLRFRTGKRKIYGND
jgi:hypothetical protein